MRGKGPKPGIVESYEQAMRRLAGPPPWRVVVAFSGGADSTALLVAAVTAGGGVGAAGAASGARRAEGSTSACFVDHAARGADEDARAGGFCREVCARLGVELDARRISVEPAGRGWEDAARRPRYEALHAARVEAGADWLLTGHTADDVAETMLMRLARGASARGLGGIPERNGVVLRPLLGVRREAVRAWLTKAEALAGLVAEGSDGPWLEDPTNADPAFLRNRVRVDVLPALLDAAPGAVEAMAGNARLLREDDAYLEEAARQALAKAVVQPPELKHAVFKGLKLGPGARAWRAARLRVLPGPLARRAVRAALVESGLGGDDLVSKHVIAVVEALDHEGFALELPGGPVARIRRGLLITERRGGRREAPPASGGTDPGVPLE